MSNKGSNKNDKKDDDLELLLAPEKVDANTFVVFGASALGVALLPAFVFVFVRALPLTDVINLAVLTVLYAVSVAGLFLSYHNNLQNKKATIAITKAADKKNRKDLNKANQDKEKKETEELAVSYSLGWTNTIFIGSFIAIQGLFSFPPLYEYILSVIAATGAIYYISGVATKQ